jgi:hypothetical protein
VRCERQLSFNAYNSRWKIIGLLLDLRFRHPD